MYSGVKTVVFSSSCFLHRFDRDSTETVEPFNTSAENWIKELYSSYNGSIYNQPFRKVNVHQTLWRLLSQKGGLGNKDGTLIARTVLKHSVVQAEQSEIQRVYENNVKIGPVCWCGFTVDPTTGHDCKHLFKSGDVDNRMWRSLCVF